MQKSVNSRRGCLSVKYQKTAAEATKTTSLMIKQWRHGASG